MDPLQMFDERRAQLERSVQELIGIRQELALGKNLFFLPDVDRLQGVQYQVKLEDGANVATSGRTYLSTDAALLFWSAYQAALPRILEDAIARGPDTIRGEARNHRTRLYELQQSLTTKIRQLDQMIEEDGKKENGAPVSGLNVTRKG